MNIFKNIVHIPTKALLSFAIAALVMAVNISAAVNCAGQEQHEKNLISLGEQKKAKEATVLLNNSRNVLPLKNIGKKSIACISIGSEYSEAFTGMLRKYAPVSAFGLPVGPVTPPEWKALNKKIKKFSTIIIFTRDQALSDAGILNFINDCRKSKELILCITGNPETVKNLESFTGPAIVSGISSEASAVFCAQAVFGGVALPAEPVAGVSPDNESGSITPVRLKYTVPEEAGIDSRDLSPIDEIINETIKEKMTPGAVVMVVKDGMVILEKAYGHHTYECREPVCTTDIYDLASITKAAASAIAVMRLYEQKKIGLDRCISSYIPETRKTNKKNITVRELMLHQSGLASYLHFSRKLKPGDYSRRYSSAYKVRVADKYFLRNGYYKKKMWPQVLKSPLSSAGEYLYSDLGMFFIKEIIERRSGESFDRYLGRNFYLPLGMQTTCFNPYEKFDAVRLVPTEVDNYLRNTILDGYVHDQAAAMMGGIAGHAGLFSDANDLAILFQMLLNRGSYGGTEYFRGETVDLFTSKPSELTRRTLGFDGWDPESEYGYPSSLASKKIFGHTGFTGTCVWADPENRLIFIFLSNRTYPDTPNRLAENNIRSRILNVIYEAVKKSESAE